MLGSRWGHPLGVPLGYWGVVYYLGVTFVALWWGATGSRWGRAGVLALGVVGVGVSAVLVAVQAFVIHGFCPWCLASAVATCGVLAGGWRGRAGLARPGWVAAVGAIAVLGMAAAVLYRPRPNTVLARFDGVVMRASDLERDDPALAAELEKDVYQTQLTYVRRKAASLAIAAEAAKRGVTPDALTAAEVDAVVAQQRAALESRAKEIAPDDEARRAEILASMLEDARAERRAEWMRGLVAGHTLDVLVREPAGRPITVDLSLAHRQGPADAKVQLVVFADLQCPVCAQLDGALERLRRSQPDLAVYFRHFPLRGHAFAEEAAVVGEGIARDKGDAAFAAYKAGLYEDVSAVDSERIATVAERVGATPAELAGWRSDATLMDRVRRSAAEARASQLDGAPSVILNGRKLDGPLDEASLRARIREAAGK